MKKSLSFILTMLLLTIFAAACASTKEPEPTAPKTTPSTTAAAKPSSGGKNLILYYSLSGNTKALAENMQKLVGGDIAEIKTVQPYPEDFHAVVEQARKERQAGYLPPIQPLTQALEDYDTIYLGYPIWGSTIPQPLATFLSQNHLAGKTVVPFCTHDGYGVGRSFQAIAEYCPDAKLLDGFNIIGSDVKSAQAPLSAWLQNIRSRAETQAPINISLGDTVLSGLLNSSPEAKEFMASLPQSITMARYGGREYYGPAAEKISVVTKGRLTFEDGDITYCPKNNTIAIFFAQTDQPNLTMEVIPIGKVTSDLLALHNLDSSVRMTFNLTN